MRRTRRDPERWSFVFAGFAVLAIFAVTAAQQRSRTLDVVDLTVAEAQRRMSTGALTSRALTQAYLDRIAAIDDAGPQLNAVIDINPAAVKEADARDAERK